MDSIASLLVVALISTTVLSIPDGRLKRSYEDALGSRVNHGSKPTGYGDSDENASVDDPAPCGLLEDSGSPERGYDFEGRPPQQRGVSVKAAAAASSSSFR